jgi:hypothetical protein
MYKKIMREKTSINANNSVEGESIETKMYRVIRNEGAITDTAPTIYQERGDGVMAGYNIRTDRWDIALDAMDKVAKSKIAGRMKVVKPTEKNAEAAVVQDANKQAT